MRGVASPVRPAAIEGQVVSVEAKKWVRKHSRARTATQQTVLETLAWASTGRGFGARVSYRAIATETKLHRNTVLRALKELELDDRIRRHREHGAECERCAGARRGVAVYDIVMPAEPDPVPVGQGNLFADAASTGTSVVPVGVPVVGTVQPSHGATTGTATVPQGSKGRREQQQLEDARESISDGDDLVERVETAFRRSERLFVDRFAIEGVVMRYVDRPELVDDAVAAVVALAADPAYRLPKGGAAMMLLYQLQRHSSPAPSASRFPRHAAAADDLPEQFSQYDVAMGLSA